MSQRIHNWKTFKGEQEKSNIYCCTECPLKQQLVELAKTYRENFQKFEKRFSELLSQFQLPEDISRGLFYKLRNPTNKAVIKYINVLNSDLQLSFLDNEMNAILQTGNMLLLRLLKNEGIDLPSYDIEKYLQNPEKYTEEIYDLLLSLSGYKQINIVGNLVTYEIPSRFIIYDYPELIKLVDLWVNELGIFESHETEYDLF